MFPRNGGAAAPPMAMLRRDYKGGEQRNRPSGEVGRTAAGARRKRWPCPMSCGRCARPEGANLNDNQGNAGFRHAAGGNQDGAAGRARTSASTVPSTVSFTPEGSSIPIRPSGGDPDDDDTAAAAAGSARSTSAKAGLDIDGTEGLVPVSSPDIANRRQV